MFNRIREYFAVRKQMQVMVNLVDMWQAGRPLAELWDVKKFANEGYRRNSLIFACITLKATSFMGPELIAYQENRDGEDQELPPEHMLAKLLATGFGRDSQSTFMRKWSTNRDVAGAAYALKVRAASGMPVQLRILRPDVIRPIPDSNGDIVAYEYGEMSSAGYSQTDLETGKESRGSAAQVIPARDIIHEMAHPDPLDPFRGLSPIAVLARMGDLDNYASDYLRSFFLNAGIPSGLLKFKTQVNKPERDKVREQWKERYGLRSWSNTASGGAFDLFVTDADVEYQEIGSKLKMMDLEQVFGETESRICGAFGVHPVLVAAWIGLLRSTMANYEQARRSLYSDTLLPNWISTADRFSVDLAQEFGENIYCRFDLSDVSELQKDKTEDKRLALDAWNSGLATKNEARGEWNFPPDGDGDVYKVGIQDTFEPAAIVVERQSLSGRTERLALPAPKERFDAVRDAEWKALHNIADKAMPALKKKSSPPLRVLKTGSR
jgi:HK97 family phage portal protein